MASTHDLSSRAQADHSKHRCKLVHDALVKNGLYERAFPAREPEFEPTPGVTRWRIAPDPFPLSSDELAFYRTLGTHLLSFYRALNRLYQDGVRGTQPAWVAAYLDQGKPESLVSYSRMKRFRDLLPGVIRPDIVPTDHGPIITELDSVPGGIGLTGRAGRTDALRRTHYRRTGRNRVRFRGDAARPDGNPIRVCRDRRLRGIKRLPAGNGVVGCPAA
ncbi:MAG: hypothetical protein C4293_17505 [Nitrospiraceae bacterium]